MPSLLRSSGLRLGQHIADTPPGNSSTSGKRCESFGQPPFAHPTRWKQNSSPVRNVVRSRAFAMMGYLKTCSTMVLVAGERQLKLFEDGAPAVAGERLEAA